MENFLVNKVSNDEDFKNLLAKFLRQNGYESENSTRGLKSALKDYQCVFGEDAPLWVKSLWTSTALSTVHLAIATKKALPEYFEVPREALRK